MGLVSKPAFTAGELDPSLWERTNLDKYRNGLATARNWIISKTGSILTRPGRQFFAQTKLVNRAVRIFYPPGGNVVFEWGHEYVRIFSVVTWTLLYDIPHTYTEDDLPNIHFEASGSFLFVFCAGKNVLKLNYAIYAFQAANAIFSVPAAITGGLTPAGSPTGYNCEYIVSGVYDGEETKPTAPLISTAAGTPAYAPLPLAAGQAVAVVGNFGAIATGVNFNPHFTEMKIYRRPYNAVVAPGGGGAFGYIGSSTSFVSSGGVIYCTFSDFGGDADYSHQPPSSVLPPDPAQAYGNTIDPGALLSNTGIVYQQKLIVSDFVTDLQALYASQTGFLNDFRRNYPLDAASALKFKCGTSGYARILRMLDSDGLVAFTSAGIYLNQGSLSPDNLAMAKKGKWIINPIVPPLAVPGGVIFLDSMTNGVRNLLWSLQLNGYDAEEVSIYSNHLFRSRTVTTWNFQVGTFPLLWIVFGDGIAAAFTFEYNQQMQAWTRHDSLLPIESCAGTTNADQTFFVVKKTDALGDVYRYIEVSLPRYVPPQYIAQDPDYDKNPSCAYMDGITSALVVMNLSLVGGDVFTFTTREWVDTAMTIPDWGGILNLDCGTSALFTGNLVAAGSVYRFFDEDKSAIDLEFIEKIDNNNVRVRVKNVAKFPSEWAEGRVKLYWTFSYITGLDYLEGEYPAVIVDGAVVASPNNDKDSYAKLQVLNGRLDLPAGMLAAIMHVGRPIVGDIETLDIDTVEQSPTLVESETVNKVYVKVKDARGLYVGPKFPTGGNGESVNGLKGMVPLDTMIVDYGKANPIVGNRAPQPNTKRFEISPEGDWSRQGKICIRQVDPVHAEILSIIPDVEVEKRIGG